MARRKIKITELEQAASVDNLVYLGVDVVRRKNVQIPADLVSTGGGGSGSGGGTVMKLKSRSIRDAWIETTKGRIFGSIKKVAFHTERDKTLPFRNRHYLAPYGPFSIQNMFVRYPSVFTSPEYTPLP